MDGLIEIFKALSDPNRIRALLALRSGEVCVCQMTELLELAPSTVSKHMSILKRAGLAESRRDEKWIIYRLPPEDNRPESVQRVLELIETSAGDCPQAVTDRERLSAVRKTMPIESCRGSCKDRSGSGPSSSCKPSRGR